MKKYKVFCRADKRGAQWRAYSGLFDTMEEAADSLLMAIDFDKCDPVIFKVEAVETTENASRSAECICFTDVQADVYEQVKKAKKAGETEKLNGIRDKYGYDLYKWALDELNKQEEKVIEILWGAACSGEIDTLKAYYENGGKVNRRYYKFGIAHSLIAGALRNGQTETVKYLQSRGESVASVTEHSELRGLYLNVLIEAAENLVDYFKYHNKNTTKAQDEKIDDLAEILRIIK